MDIFDLLSLAGGVAVLLFGMRTMVNGLNSFADYRLQNLLTRLTDNVFKSILLGVVVTSITHSSAATVVMVAGFVGSGVMNLHQAVGVIMGANIGTTTTAWLLSLANIQGDSFILKLINPSGLASVLAVAGMMLILGSNKNKNKTAGEIMAGLAILLLGMQIMSGSVAPLKDSLQFEGMLHKLENPFFGVLVGTGLTAILQSSTASVGILQALTLTGKVSWRAAIPIIVGQNIGSTFTTLFAVIGAGKDTQRAIAIHLSISFIGAILFLIIFYMINAIRPFSFLSCSIDVTGVATFHTFFNLFVTAALLPFTKQLVKLSTVLVRD